MDKGFYRLTEVLSAFPVSKQSWYAGIRRGIYPRPVKLGLRTVGWRKNDIHELIEKHSTGEMKHGE